MNIVFYWLFVILCLFYINNNQEFRDINEALKTPLSVKKLVINAGFGYDKISYLNRIGELKNLEELEISECPGINTLPDGITELSKLRVLRFNWNGGDGIDDWHVEFEKLAELDSLEVLILGYYNNIGHLSSKVGELKNLKGLYLSMTETQSLPKEMGKLKKLEYLDISMTQIEKLPKELAELPNLKKIIIFSTPLSRDVHTLKKTKEFFKNCEFIEEQKPKYNKY